MEPQNKSPEVKKKVYVIVDTNVISYAASKPAEKGEKVRTYLRELESRGFSLAVSEISVLEHLDGLWGWKAKRAAILLDKFEYKKVSKVVLVAGARLRALYREWGTPLKDTGDIIVAATAMLEDGLVLTNNHKHYPSPFFIQAEWKPISYDCRDKSGKAHHTETKDLVLFKPNIVLFDRLTDEKKEQWSEEPK